MSHLHLKSNLDAVDSILDDDTAIEIRFLMVRLTSNIESDKYGDLIIDGMQPSRFDYTRLE